MTDKDDQIDKLKNKINTLQDDAKELILENKDLKEQITNLKIKSIDPTKYKTWDTNDVLSWILSLDNKLFLQYQDKLKKCLFEEQIQGNDLQDVNEIDVKGWGITKFAHKKKLVLRIKELVHDTNTNMYDEQTINEGAPTAYI